MTKTPRSTQENKLTPLQIAENIVGVFDAQNLTPLERYAALDVVKALTNLLPIT